MSRVARLLILATTLATAACGSRERKPDLPPAVVVKPEVVFVDRYIYVSVDRDLTRQHPIAEGPLSMCPDVARARKAELQKCNADKREIRAIEGTPKESKP